MIRQTKGDIHTEKRTHDEHVHKKSSDHMMTNKKGKITIWLMFLLRNRIKFNKTTK